MTRKDYIEKLVEELGASLAYDAARYEMHVFGNELHLAPWDEIPEEEVYWVGLHELGHLALTNEGEFSHTLSRFDDYMMADLGLPHWAAEREALAWAWALDHAHLELDQAGESSIAWGLADRLSGNYIIGEGLRRIHAELGEDPDWFFNVVTPEHFEKLEGYARPRWRRLTQRIAEEKAEA